MDSKFVKLIFDLHCDWEGMAPSYRLYVNDELFTERTFRWQEPYYLEENLQVLAGPGLYKIKLEILKPSLAKFQTKNWRVAVGPARIINDWEFEIQ